MHLLTTGATAKEVAELREHPIQYDILGVNFYPWLAQNILLDEQNKWMMLPVPRNGLLLADVLRRCYAHTRQPLFVTETSAREDIAGRGAWMDETITAVHRVRAEGIPVVGYT